MPRAPPQVKQIDDDESQPVRIAPVAAAPPFRGDPGPADVPHASDVVFGMSTMERFQVGATRCVLLVFVWGRKTESQILKSSFHYPLQEMKTEIRVKQ